MNGIGITEWRRTGYSYPLNADSDLAGLFYDATFVLFDTESPVLSTITIGDQLGFVFSFSDTDTTFLFDRTDCVENAVLRLRNDGRYYGSLTLGPLITQVANGSFGIMLAVQTAFHLNTVQFINSKLGLLSLQGQTGSVVISSSDDIQASVLPVRFDAISMPNNLKHLNSDATGVYTWDPRSQKMSKLNDSSTTNILDPAQITGFLNTSNASNINYFVKISNGSTPILVGVSYDANKVSTTIFDCSFYPGKVICRIPDIRLISVASVGTTLVGLTDNNELYSMGVYPFSAGTPVALTVAGFTKIAGVSNGSGSYVVATKPGLLDTSTSTNTSSIFYKLALDGTPQAAGPLVHSGNSHLPAIVALGSGIDSHGNTAVIALAGNQFYVISAIGGYLETTAPTIAGSIASSPTDGSIVSGGWAVTFTPVIPLKKINNHTPVSNNLQLTGNELVGITRTGSNQLTVSIVVDDAQLNVNRSQYYE